MNEMEDLLVSHDEEMNSASIAADQQMKKLK